MQSTQRLHALDAVRAFALLAGIVLHTAMSFMPGLAMSGYPADSSQSMALQYLFYVIHVFRMGLFFFIAGFFGRMLFHRKGPRDFLRDRGKRILVPFVLGWLAFGPITMAIVYLLFGPATQSAEAPMPEAFPLSHLWFLYYLALLYGFVLALRALILRASRRHATFFTLLDSRVKALFSIPLCTATLALPMAITLYLSPDWILWGGIPSPDMGFTPDATALACFGMTFVTGWLVQRQVGLLPLLKQRGMIHVLAAIILTALSLWMIESQADPEALSDTFKFIYALTYTTAMWNWILGLVGAALNLFDTENSKVRYIADASYWMYLAHLPVVFALQLIVLEWNMHWSVKFTLINVATLAILLTSYRYLVRSTWTGALLNGRKKTKVAISPDASEAKNNLKSSLPIDPA